MRIGSSPNRRGWLVLAILLGVATTIWWSALRRDEPRGLFVLVIDVGQGDCIFLRTPSGKTVLVDGGGHPDASDIEETGCRVVLPVLRHYGVNRLDLVVLSHPHDDHIQGLIPVLRTIPVRMVLDPGVDCNSEAYDRFCSVIATRRIERHRAVRGQAIDFHDGVTAETLNPPGEHLTGTSDDANSNSVVLRVSYGGSSLLLTGDAGTEAEASMLASGVGVRSTVLKVGHHGSSSATSEEWLSAVSPRVALISVGMNNTFGHPSPSVLSRLSAHSIKTLRTDRDGAIAVLLAEGAPPVARTTHQSAKVRSLSQGGFRRP